MSNSGYKTSNILSDQCLDELLMKENSISEPILDESQHSDKEGDKNKNQRGNQELEERLDEQMKELWKFNQRMEEQEDKAGKMTEELRTLRKNNEGLKHEVEIHNEAMKKTTDQIDALESKLEEGIREQGKIRKDISKQIEGPREQRREDFANLEGRIKKLEEKNIYSYTGVFFILVSAIIVFAVYSGQPVPKTSGRTPTEMFKVLERKFDQDVTDLRSSVDIKISDFLKNELASVSSNLRHLKADYENLVSNTELKIRENQREMSQKQQLQERKKIEDEVNLIINGRLQNIGGDFKALKEQIENVLQERGDDSNTIVILVVMIIVFTVVLVMLMLRKKRAPIQRTYSSSPGLRAGYLRPYFLDDHDDILAIPRSKVIIVYVEKNQRNIILEDPDQQFGDLRRTTVEAASKMGAHTDGRRLFHESGVIYVPVHAA